MRVLLVNRFFGGSQTPTGRMLHDVAEQLAAAGHDVVVLTSNGGYVSTEPGLIASNAPRFDVRIVHQSGSVPRFVNWVWFWLQAVVRIPLMRWDRCLLLTDPPFLTIAGLLVKIFHGNSRRVFWWTMDLYPDALHAARILSRSSVLYWMLQQCIEISLGGLDGVIALGPRQHDRLLAYRQWRKVPSCIVVPPWDNRLLPRPSSGANLVLKRYGWEGLKIALYAGNLGEGHAFGEFLECARWFHLRKRSDWLFVFAVRGSGVAALRAEAGDMPNLKIIDYLPEADTAPLLWSATVHLISMKREWEGVIVPSKLYGVIKTEAPVLFIGPEDADITEELRRLRRGKVLPAGSNGAVVASVLEELGQPQWRASPVIDVAGFERVADYVCRH